VAASVVGWSIVVLVLWIFGGALLGTIWWLARMVLIFIVIGLLIALYLRLRGPD